MRIPDSEISRANTALDLPTELANRFPLYTGRTWEVRLWSSGFVNWEEHRQKMNFFFLSMLSCRIRAHLRKKKTYFPSRYHFKSMPQHYFSLCAAPPTRITALVVETVRAYEKCFSRWASGVGAPLMWEVLNLSSQMNQSLINLRSLSFNLVFFLAKNFHLTLEFGNKNEKISRHPFGHFQSNF